MKNLSDLVASKQTAKNRFFSIVSPATRGFFRDESWQAVTQIVRSVHALGGEMETASVHYFNGPDGFAAGKRWVFNVKANGFSFNAILTATFADKPNGDVYDLCLVLN